MADKSMVEYSDYAMESTGLTGMISSGLPEIAGEKTKMKKRKPKERIYVCHTYYHVYVACLKELTLPRAMRGKADLVLSTMSNDFGSLKERAEKSGLFEAVFMFEEKEEQKCPTLDMESCLIDFEKTNFELDDTDTKPLVRPRCDDGVFRLPDARYLVCRKRRPVCCAGAVDRLCHRRTGGRRV